MILKYNIVIFRKWTELIDLLMDKLCHHEKMILFKTLSNLVVINKQNRGTRECNIVFDLLLCYIHKKSHQISSYS